MVVVICLLRVKLQHTEDSMTLQRNFKHIERVRFGSATRTQNFEREVLFFFDYFSNFPLFLFVKLPDFRSRSLGPAISHCWSLFSPKLRV